MADGDHTIQLPPRQRATIDRNETGMMSRFGTPLRQRLDTDFKMLQTPDFDIIVDNGDLLGGLLPDGFTGPAIINRDREPKGNFSENLAKKLDDGALAQIGNEVVEGVEADVTARSGWVDQYTKGLDLLGQRIEDQPQTGKTQSISRASEPLLIEAMVKYQSGAEAEMLPAAGPGKVETIGQQPPEEEQRAKEFQDDWNYLLTEVMREYYPDSGSMLMHQAYCGLGYKKVYKDPILRRPTSRSVLAPDLIVSEEATDLDTALRVTHQIQMLKADLRRMQIIGHYRDINLGAPTGSYGLSRQAQIAIRRAQGQSGTGSNLRPNDMPYEIYETDVGLDPEEMGIDFGFERKAPWGLPLPYKVAVEKNSRQVLGVWRNWDDGDQLYLKQNMFVKFGMVPGLDFYSWGFLQLLGNQTKVLRSILRLLIDAGMFASFPGGVKLKQGRMSTNEIAPTPGEFVDIDYSGVNPDISRLIMPFPYKGPDATFVQLYQLVRQDAKALAGTVTIEVGEGRTNIPVGTVMAMVEQQVQIMSGVFKRNHQAQKDEFHKIRKLFAEDPKSLSRLVRGRPRADNGEPILWSIAEEFMDLNLVPASDPNVPGRTHAVMLANVLVMLADSHPALYNALSVHRNALQAIGANPDAFLNRPEQMQAAPPPEDPKVTAAKIRAQSETEKTQAKTQEIALSTQLKREELGAHAAEQAAANETARQVAAMRHDADTRGAQVKAQADMVGDHLEHQREQQAAQLEHQREMQSQREGHRMDLIKAGMGHAAKIGEAQMDHAHAMRESAQQRAHEAAGAAEDRQHEMMAAHAERRDRAMAEAAARQHEAAGGVADRQFQAAEAERQRQHEMATGMAERQHETAQTEAQRRYDTTEQAAQRRHELATGSIQHQYESEDAAKQREYESQDAERQRQHEATEGKRDRAARPKGMGSQPRRRS